MGNPPEIGTAGRGAVFNLAGQLDQRAVVWKRTKDVPSTPSFLVDEDTVFFVNDDGVAVCLDAGSGEVIWRQRLNGEFSASPIQMAGRLYFFSHDATTFVLRANRQFQELATNKLEGELRATPAVVGDTLFVRTKTHLYRIEDSRSTP